MQISRIQKFIHDGFVRPVRLVIDHDGEIWIDNLHSTLAQVLCQGNDIMLGSLPAYIADMRNNMPKIIDPYDLVEFDRDKINRVLIASKKRCERSSEDVKAAGYTIGEFMKDNEITMDALTLPPVSYYCDFNRITDRLMYRS